jgi:hypothetical protein
LGHATTAAIPARQAARTSSSRLAYMPTRLSTPIWFRMIDNSGTALAKCGYVPILDCRGSVWYDTHMNMAGVKLILLTEAYAWGAGWSLSP